jgi:hypothetical protein
MGAGAGVAAAGRERDSTPSGIKPLFSNRPCRSLANKTNDNQKYWQGLQLLLHNYYTELGKDTDTQASTDKP